MPRIAKYGLLAVLTLHLFWRGLLPAFTKIDTDFPNYYVASKLALEGNFDRSYDDVWFQGQIRSFGMNQMGKFSPFPPSTALVMIPLAWLSPLNALRAWTVLNLAILAGSIVLLSRIVKKDWLWSSLLFLLGGNALVNDFRFGQFYLTLSFLCMCALYSWQGRRQTTSGVLMGIGAMIKYFPVVFLPICIIRREWKVALAFSATIVVFSLLSIAALGIGAHVRFVEEVPGPHLAGEIQNPFSSSFQSWNSLLRRLFVFDAGLNPHPLFDSPVVFYAGLGSIYGFIVGLVALGLSKLEGIRKGKELEIEFALVSIGGILLFPVSATYHFLLLTVPVAILLSVTETKWRMEQKILVTLYTLIGFIPYSLFQSFDGRGLLTVLAYPRLFLMAMVFTFALYITNRLSREKFLSQKIVLNP